MRGRASQGQLVDKCSVSRKSIDTPDNRTTSPHTTQTISAALTVPNLKMEGQPSPPLANLGESCRVFASKKVS